MLINLVLNAAEATGPGGRIDVRLTGDGAEARLEVHDDGPGIPEERRPGIFEAFETTKPDGTGLGLFSVQHIAEVHGGRAEALASELGGACFRVSLPVAGGAEA
jgi:two-component system NtrC family sensor kinase